MEFFVSADILNGPLNLLFSVAALLSQPLLVNLHSTAKKIAYTLNRDSATYVRCKGNGKNVSGFKVCVFQSQHALGGQKNVQGRKERT